MTWFLTNWRVVAIVLLVAVPSFYATVTRLQRDAARSTIMEMTLAARAQEAYTAAEVARQKAITKERDNEHTLRIDRLNNLAARQHDELLERAGRSIVPAVPTVAGDRGSREGPTEGIVCFARDRLSEGISGDLQRFAGRFAEFARRGASAVAGFKACADWAIEESAKPVLGTGNHKPLSP